MQHICKWYYITGAGRVQTSITLLQTKYFTVNIYNHSLRLSLLAYKTGGDLGKIKCSNIDDYNSVEWYSC